MGSEYLKVKDAVSQSAYILCDTELILPQFQAGLGVLFAERSRLTDI